MRVSHPGTIYRTKKKKKKNNSTQVHIWVVYRFGDILGSVGHRVKIDKITPVTGKERDDIDFKDYHVVLQKPQEQTGRPSSSAYTHTGLYFDSHAFRKIIGAFYRTADTHEEFGWCS